MTNVVAAAPPQVRSSTIRRIGPALGLLVLAPWIGEYLLGNISARYIGLIPFLIPMYGCGALLIREAARRTHRGWPTMFILAAAYGIVEAGLVDQSLFNPSFGGWGFQKVTPIPALGISAYNSVTFIVGHVVWSISIPIALMEMLVPSRCTTPWLGTFGLATTGLFYLLGCWIIFVDLVETENFMATPTQLITTTTITLALICIAFAIKHHRVPLADRYVPKVWQLGIGSFVFASVYTLRPENWVGVVIGIVFVGIAAMLVVHLTRQRGWTSRHQLALVSGTLLTYAWLGFVLTGLTAPDDPIAWIGNVLFALLAVALLVVIAKVNHRAVEVSTAGAEACARHEPYRPTDTPAT